MTNPTRIETPSLQQGEDAARAVQQTPNRVTLESIKLKIREVHYLPVPGLPHATVACLILKNGFIVFGESVPADPENYDADLGKRFAYEAALRKVWPLEAYLLREYLADEEQSQRAAELDKSF